jgi:rhamnose utilization protein RhaD (predicted bifunctional aldolase and dehydrogenase)
MLGVKASNCPIMIEELRQLLELSHQLGDKSRELAILGEGNTSTKISDDTFAVKASGSSLQSLDTTGIARCRISEVLSLFERENITDDEIEVALLESRVFETDRKPSTEALFHAYLLTLPDVNFVGHTHPIACKFPDEIVCCGPVSALVPYVNPGVPLARAIRAEVERFTDQYGKSPRLILLRNHGVIALGKTANAVLATTLMAEKAAKIFLGAASLGGPEFLTEEQVEYIAGWTAEHYRQKVLKL